MIAQNFNDDDRITATESLSSTIQSLSRLSKREQEYLEAIYILSRGRDPVRVKDVAVMLNIRPSSAVELLRRLSEKGLISYERYKSIRLTDLGRSVAERVYMRHKALKEFLSSVLGLPEEIAERDACYIEHGIHDETLDRIISLMELVRSHAVECPSFSRRLDRLRMFTRFTQGY